MLMRLLVFGLLVVCAQGARAIVVTFDAAASSGNTYVYNVTLEPGAFMRADSDPASITQNAFTLYDFPGLVSATFAKDLRLTLNEFVLSTPTTGFNPIGIAPEADAALPNITVRLDSGPDIEPLSLIPGQPRAARNAHGHRASCCSDQSDRVQWPGDTERW